MNIEELAAEVKLSREVYDTCYTGEKESLRLAHLKLHKKFVKAVEALPNPIKDLDAEIEAAQAKIKSLQAQRDALAKKCKHLAYHDRGGHTFFIEECVQCGEINVI